MKLISEQHVEDNVSFLFEESEGFEKQLFIHGVFMQADVENKNKRIYPKSVLESAVEEYVNNFVITGRSGGELNHPPTPKVDPERISHRVTSLHWEGNNVIGKALIIEEAPLGKTVKGLLKGGIKLGVSSRGMGTVEKRGGKSYVKNDFRLAAVDIVYDPSAPSAFVNGIMEGVEWITENGILKPQEIENYETEIEKSIRQRNLGEAQIRLFEDFLSKHNKYNLQ